MPADAASIEHGLRIAVAGATGRVGRALIELLASDAVDVVALTRRPDAARLPEGVAVAAVDFGRPESLRDALRGAERLFLAQGTSARQVENEVALIDAAIAAGVRHIVKLSALGPPTRLNPYAWHMDIEAHLARQPVTATVLRPSAFVDILKRAGPQVAADAWAGAAGHGRVNFVDPRDVASVGRIALLAAVEAGTNRAYHITGPRAWTMQDVAQELSGLLGRPIAYGVRSLDEQRAALLGDGLPPLAADLLTGLDRLFRASALAETTLTVQELTGRSPRTLSGWLAENVAIFRG